MEMAYYSKQDVESVPSDVPINDCPCLTESERTFDSRGLSVHYSS